MTNEELNRIMTKADNDLDALKDRCHYLYEENKTLKARIDKASEYIKQHTDKLTKIRVPKLDFNYENLLNILQGENNE